MLPNQRAFVHPEVKASNADQREIVHLITTASVDRAGDVVDPGGADLSNYLKNPVVMRDHSYKSEDIIGKATSIEIQDDGIWARTQFRDTDAGRDGFKLAAEGLGGWSIGFRPVEYEALKDDKGRTKGFRFSKWELLEYSQVPIPMNQDIVNNAVQRGLVSLENVPLFFKQETEQAKPDIPAAPGPTVEPVIDTTPAREAFAEALRTFERADMARQIQEAIE